MVGDKVGSLSCISKIQAFYAKTDCKQNFSLSSFYQCIGCAVAP